MRRRSIFIFYKKSSYLSLKKFIFMFLYSKKVFIVIIIIIGYIFRLKIDMLIVIYRLIILRFFL